MRSARATQGRGARATPARSSTGSIAPAAEAGPARHATSIDGRTDEARLDIALEVAELFRLPDDDAKAIVREVAAATAAWRTVAADLSLSSQDIDRMSRAFEQDQAAYAKSI